MTETAGALRLSSNRTLALIWRLLIVAACCAGLYSIFFGKPFSARSLCYFTTQSNIFVALLALVLLAGTLSQIKRTGRRGEVYHIAPWVQLGITFFVQITFLVYAAMLSSYTFSMGFEMAVSNILLHYVVPIMALADWLIFMPHGRVNYRHAALWLIYPAAYVVFCFIRAELGPPFFDGARFPYFFMDADKLGLNLLWIAPAFFAAYFGLGCFLVWIDKHIAKLIKKRLI